MRIASLQPSITQTLSALGRLDCLCAHTRYCVEVLPELAGRGLPVLQDSWSFDKSGTIEMLLATKPDLVIASVPYRMESLAAILRAGLPMLALAPHSLADIYADIRLIASVVQASTEADAVVATMQSAIEATRRRAAELAGGGLRPVMYCEEWGKPLIHSQAWVAELVDAAGAEFLGTPGAHTSAEAVADADPDVLVFAWCGAGDRVPMARVIEQRGWTHLRAVRQGRVHCVPDQFLNTPAPALLDGLACLAAAANPEHTRHPAMLSLTVADRERLRTYV